MFREFMVNDLKVNEKRVRDSVDNSLMLVTALAPKIGYDKAAEIAHNAYHDDSSLLEATLKLGYLSEEEFRTLMRPELMTEPHA